MLSVTVRIIELEIVIKREIRGWNGYCIDLYCEWCKEWKGEHQVSRIPGIGEFVLAIWHSSSSLSQYHHDTVSEIEFYQ